MTDLERQIELQITHVFDGPDPDWDEAVSMTVPHGTVATALEGAIGNTPYAVRQRAVDVFGRVSDWSTPAEHTTALDTTAPSTPTGLAAIGAILGLIATWDASTAVDLSHYELQVDDDIAFGSPTTYKVKVNVASITQLSAGTWYVRVRAVDTSGNASSYTSGTSAVARKVTGSGTGGTDIVAASIAAADITARTITASQIAVGTLTASELAVGALKPNMILNGSFEVGDASILDAYVAVGTTNDETFLRGWSAQDATMEVNLLTSANAKTGTRVGAFRSTALNSRFSQLIPVVAGRTYRLTGWHWKAVAGGVTSRLRANTVDAVFATVGFNVIFDDTTAASPVFADGVYTIPTDGSVSYLRVELLANGTPGGTEVFAWEDITLVEVPNNVSNTAATVIINEDGITITDGALTFEDEFGSTVLTGGGFGASWFDFIQSGFYNSTFAAGTTNNITAATEVSGGDSVADYEASLSSDLPYWIVSAETGAGTFQRVADSTASSGFALRWSGTEDAEVYQDALVVPGHRYRLMIDWRFTNSASDFNLEVAYSYRNATHGIIGSETSQTLNYTAAGSSTYDLFAVLRTAEVAPNGARYLRWSIRVARQSGSPTVHIDAVKQVESAREYSTIQSGELEFVDNSSLTRAISIKITSQTFHRFQVLGSGALLWSSGTAVQDIRLYRESATKITLDDDGGGPVSFNLESTTDLRFNDTIAINQDTTSRLSIFSLGATEPRVGLELSNGHATTSSGYFVWNDGDSVARASLGKHTGGAPAILFGDGSAAQDVVLWRSSAGNASLLGRFVFTSDISPAQLTGNTDNWNPTGLSGAAVIRISVDAPRNITGIVAQTDGSLILLVNTTTSTITLVHDATSTAANRFYCPGAANYSLTSRSSVFIWYDGTSDRWRVVA